MELRHLRYFTAVATHGSFNQAAASLHLTQPALSRQVKDLEDELGVPLLKRGKNAVTLTEAGELFYDEARDLLARAEQAVRRVRRETGAIVLRIAYAPSLVAGVLPRALERFQAETPQARVELSDLAPAEMAKQGREGLLDVIFSVADEEWQLKEFAWHEARRLTPMLVMPAKHPLARLKRVPPARLRDLPMIGYHRAEFPEYDRGIRRLLKGHGVSPYYSHRAEGMTSLLASIEAHGGVSILTEGVASFLPVTLVMRPFFPALPGVTIVAGVSASRTNPHAERFVQLFREESGLIRGGEKPKSRKSD